MNYISICIETIFMYLYCKYNKSVKLIEFELFNSDFRYDNGRRKTWWATA